MAIKYATAKGISEIVLTFDDGPHPTLTPKLLDLLNKENIKGLFFVLGENVAKKGNIDIVKRIFTEGHTIGNHTYSHKSLKSLSDQEIKDEILKTEDLIREYLSDPKLLRPPYGATNIRVNKIIQDLGYSIVLWNVDTMDWRDKESWVKNTLSQVNSREDSNILMHDIHKTTVEKIPDLIKKIKSAEKKHTFVTYV